MKDVPFTVELDAPVAEPGRQPAIEPTPPPGGPLDAEPGGDAGVWSVTQLTRRIRNVLEEGFAVVGVEGELSNVKAAASGHLYFNLKDEKAQIRCVMFRSAAASLRFAPEDGLQVRLRGRLSVYEQRGEYQIQVLMLEPQGTGALQLAFEQLKRKLEAEGLFASERKRELPYLPRRIGVVTSPTGAAIRDILTVLERRFRTVPVLLYPAVVQGPGAAGEIVAGIEALNRLAEAQQIDVLIVGRGGGSVEDLWAFNEEPVARAIHGSRVPVISAVGHEVDFTIADFVADVRAATPSAAAELAVPNRADLVAGVDAARQQLFRRMEEALGLRGERWSYLRSRLGSPEAVLRQQVLRLDELWERVRHAGAQTVRAHRERFAHARQSLSLLRPTRLAALQRQAQVKLKARLIPALTHRLAAERMRLAAQLELLDSLSPLTVMRRGYGAVSTLRGPVRSVTALQPGESLTVRLHDGRVDAEVRAIHPTPSGAAPEANGGDEP